MGRITDCARCGKVHALHKDGTVMGPNDGIAYKLDPTAFRLLLMPVNERDCGWNGPDKEATLCASCAAPLQDYIRGIGLLTPETK